MYLLYEIAGHTFGFVTRAPGLSGRSPQKEPDVFSSCRKALLVSSALCLMPLTDASAHIPEESGPDPGCTVLEGTRQISLEVIAPHSADFCPLLARAVGEDVLHARWGSPPRSGTRPAPRARVVSTWERGSSRRSRSTTRARPAAGCRRAAGSRSNRLRPGTGRPRRKGPVEVHLDWMRSPHHAACS